MDKKNTFLGIVCILAGIGYMFWQARELEEQRRQQLLEEPVPAEQAESTTPADAVLEPAESGAATEAADSVLDLLAKNVATGDETAEGVVAEAAQEEKTVTLSNEFIEVEFTTRGGAIRTVSFLQTKRGERDDYVFNQDGLLPALSMSLANHDGNIREFALNYVIEQQSADSITFALDAGGGLVIRRTYTISQGEDAEHDPYIIRHSTSFDNQAATAKALSTIYLNLGTARPISAKQPPQYLNVGYYDGEDSNFTAISKLTGGKGFFGKGGAPKDEIELSARIEWASVKNQFFAAVLSSDTIGDDLYIYPVAAPDTGDATPGRPGITANVGYPAGTVAAGASRALDFDFYVGPKEFKRLQALGNDQDLVMQFGIFGFFSKLLLAFMYAIHAVIPSWGWSIVIMTVCVKTLFWPLTAKASRSQKRMAKIQEPMAALKEKYKDNPQKLQQETLKLFRENKVNPVAGCLPMFIQMPIFLGLFYMLRTASELRHEPFLWVADLSMPDTMFVVAGFPVNILPMIMGVSMILQMRMMPASPTADAAQQKILKFMPLLFLVFLYNYASGLVLYWTVQNLLTILQQKIVNRLPDEDLKPAAADARPLKKAKPVSSKAKGRVKKK